MSQENVHFRSESLEADPGTVNQGCVVVEKHSQEKESEECLILWI